MMNRRDPSLRAEGIRFAYPSLAPGAPSPWVLDGLDLALRPGEWLAVMGASDAGKTTLCLLLAGLAPHLTGGTMEGRVLVAGKDTRQHPPPALADRVGLLFQEPDAQLFNPSVEAEIAWGLENLGLPPAEIGARVEEMLGLFHLEAVRHRPPASLSGGEKKRTALAAILAMRPAFLILDEPLGGLDPVGRREVLSALEALRRNHDVAILMTESDPEAVVAFADRVAVLHRGRLVAQDSPRALFRRAAEMAAWGVAVPQIARLAAALNRRLGTDFGFLTVEEALPQLSALPRGQDASARDGEPSVEAEPDSAPDVPALQVRGLEFRYDAARPVLRGLDLDVPQGQFVAIVGANGSGKTTLAKQFNGLLRPRRGVVRVEGRDVADHSIGEMARRVGFLFQHPEQQIFSTTVRREVAFGPRNLGLPPAEVEARVRAALNRFDLSAVAEEPPAILSYGLRRRVTLASLAAQDPPILILDEPTVGLDAAGRAETFAWLTELHAQGRTILLISHDMALVAAHARRVIVLHRGRILADGPPATVFGDSDLLARASLEPPPVAVLARLLGLPPHCLTVDAFCAAFIRGIGGKVPR